MLFVNLTGADRERGELGLASFRRRGCVATCRGPALGMDCSALTGLAFVLAFAACSTSPGQATNVQILPSQALPVPPPESARNSRQDGRCDWKVIKAKPPTRVVRNVWHPRDDALAGLVIRARDFSDYYRAQAPSELWSVGRSHKDKTYWGPYTPMSQAERACEVLPETLIGTPYAKLTPTERSTFGVVRAVSEVECYAFFDVGNAYDLGMESTGIFHFVIMSSGAGELAGVLHRLMKKYPGDYERGIRFFGTDVEPPRLQASQERSARLSLTSRRFLPPALNGHWIPRSSRNSAPRAEAS